ncbi:hypothetical protein RFI_31611 [Reticulomyxa filosa]|uniref:Uncharacterized protein n=1 Tax=Reticulomyxa filosa TaxID=46433 RepID=X6LVX9_RETFI|nr:hypothetical protein RFI_31611 [Reticulomyxa filosa]|eukprot:ETO05779.1 hypothetical protein RFI_31611 [Reticulomyxa filosa]
MNNEDTRDFVLIDKAKCKGGMQNSNGDNTNAINEGDKKYEKEIKTLIRLFGDPIDKEELKKKIINSNGNIELVIKELVQLSVENEVYYNNNNISCFITIDVFFYIKKDKSKINELENIEQVTTKLFRDNFFYLYVSVLG